MLRSWWLLVALAACDADAKSAPAHLEARVDAVATTAPAARQVNPRLLRRFRPLGASPGPAAMPAMVNLGRQLFYDPRLSRDRDVSCNSCHRLDHYGVDNEVTSKGADGKRGRRNSPTVFHAAGQFVQFWDGRSPDIDAQAGVPILAIDEMDMASPETVTTRLHAIPEYVAAFDAAFPGGDAVTFANVGAALGAFERGLVAPSRWDHYLGGEQSALTDQEIDGFKSFSDLGCVTCHTGELIGGTSYQRAGAINAWPNQRDLGRYEVTKVETDRMVFKVPTLRNVAKTAPYFHDGEAKTLEEAVRMMAHHQLDVELSDAEVANIVAWLGTLTGELPAAYIKQPTLPRDAL
jgi:cytochrome c peroxidase